MAKTDEITELDELAATKVSGVGSPANGTRFIVLKAEEPDDEDGPFTDDAEKSDSAEADEIGDEVTGEAEKSLSAAERDKMPASSFAYVDAKGGKHLPIHDEGHVRAAMGRLDQQDFSGAKGDPGKAKAAAARKISAAAKKHGIDVSDDSNVAEASKEITRQHLPLGEHVVKSPGVPEESVETPASNGTVESGTTIPYGTSGLTGPATAGETAQPAPADSIGGESSYEIPADHRDLDPSQELAKTVTTVANLMEAIEVIRAQREAIGSAVKAGLTVTPPSMEQSMMPGDMPWESYDSATMAQVAECLANCKAAVETIMAREQMEAATADPSDMNNVFDLQDASSALSYALGIVAMFSFTEAAEATKEQDLDEAAKAGRRLSGKTEGVLRAARDHLTSVIGDGEQHDNSSEEDDIMAAVTKEDLVAAFVEAQVTFKQLEEEAAKNANNGGDISESELHANGEISSDLTLPGSSTTTAPVSKGADDATVETLLKAVQAQGETLTALGEQVAKFAQRPRALGPILDGQNRVTPALEGRQGEAAKSGDTELAALESNFAKAQETGDPSRIDQAGRELTLAKLKRHNAQFV